MRGPIPIEPEPPMVTAIEILTKVENYGFSHSGESNGLEPFDLLTPAKACTKLSDEVFAAIDRVRAKHPEGLGRQNACKGMEEEMREFFGKEEV